MTQEQIIEANKLIAEFMNIPCFKNLFGDVSNYPDEYMVGEILDFIASDEYLPTFYSLSEMEFHSSWDWLMEVVEKIESLEEFGGIVSITQGQCKITSRMAGDNSVYADKSHYMMMGARGKLPATYEAVVEFIKWYNSLSSCQE